MSILKTCPYCEGRGYISRFENNENECRAWSEKCVVCEGTGSILFPETNADRIRRMSDEELAEHIWGKFGCPDGKTNVTCGYVGECKGCWLEWLKHPVEEADQ